MVYALNYKGGFMKINVKAMVLRIIIILGFLAMCISMIIAELNITWAFVNSLAAFNGVIPSAAVLVSNIVRSFVNKFHSKQKFAKWSVLTFVIAYIIGIVCGFVHYEMPLMFGAFYFYVYQLGIGIILSALFGVVIYLLSMFYFRLIKE